MKRRFLVAAVLLALSALTMSRLVSPTRAEARITLYQRRPWRK